MDKEINILLVEDDIELRNLVISHFKEKKFEFTVFDDPAQVFERGEREADFLVGFDLVITDFRMPNLDGIQFIKKFRAICPQTPIILMTATNRIDLAVEAIRAGAYDFVPKPLHFEQLDLSVERALQMNDLRRQNSFLKSSLRNSWAPTNLVGKSRAFLNVLDLAHRVARSTANVLISGESGTGKEVIAKFIHQASHRANGPFVAINCSAIPESLLESELFGHKKGAFTGATDRKTGIFEEAHKGSIFLDEIGDLRLPLQSKLLRVLQERKIKRVGENTERDIDVRVIAATHKDLRTEVREERFREDLFFRLNVVQLRVPPLRERREDIVPLAKFFLERFSAQCESPAREFSRDAMSYLMNAHWAGNVRELENAIERAVVLARGPTIEVADFTDAAADDLSSEGIDARQRGLSDGQHFVASLPSDRLLTLEEISRLYASFVLGRVGGIKEQAALVLGIDRKTLYRKLGSAPVQLAPVPMGR